MSRACLFLTGATGFVGGATAFELLHDERVDRLLLLARGESAEHARERVRCSLQRFGELPARWREVTVLAGDLVTVELAPALVDAVTHVVHAAACTSFRSVREVRRTNVHGTAALAARFARGHRLERFVHVSTAFRCGAVAERFIREETPASPEHVVEYTKTKAEAESLVEQMDGLPWLIARPSVVVGHSLLGVKPSTSLYWYYQALAMAGIAPFPEDRRRDIVAVDYVARALVHLLFLKSPQHRHFHVSAGEGASVSWGELRAGFGRSTPTRTVAASELSKHPVWRELVGDDARFRAGLDACSRFSELPIEWFSNERLLASGMLPPVPLTQYLPRCLETADRGLLELMSDDA
jgi:nucleoside-diphosphate-sugar epimerase